MKQYKIKNSTWLRVVIIAVAMINQILVVFGMSPIPLDEATINEVAIQIDMLVASLMTIAAGAWGSWKDNDISQKALKKKAEIEEKE